MNRVSAYREKTIIRENKLKKSANHSTEVIVMDKSLRNFDFFNSLPAHMQETLMQSGVKFESEQELKNFVQKMNEPEQKNGFEGFHTM